MQDTCTNHTEGFSVVEFDPHTTPVPSQHSRPSVHTPNPVLPPVQSLTDKRALHRADAHTNICLICQLPRWSYSHQPNGEAVCCCDEQEGAKRTARRFTTTGHEEYSAVHMPPPVQVGQRRHSMMMARLNEGHFDYKPHPPERGHTGTTELDI